MSARSRLVLLAALSAGAVLVGAELLITAVALPRLVPDLADWTQLRRASWVVNGYLLAYIAMMPLAGRLGDRYGIPRLMVLALALFAVGSVLSGIAPSLDALIAARVVQGLGAGAILPLATAGASHLYAGPMRARALGVVGAATFLGMALGPFLGASILHLFELRPALNGADAPRILVDLLTPAWRWVFLLGAPVAIAAMAWIWAAAPAWPVERSDAPLDATGAALWTTALAGGLIAITALGEATPPGAVPVPAVGAIVAVVSGVAAWRHARSVEEPFLDLRLLRDRVFGGALLLSLLTGYALATAIVGAAVFVDRVRYAGPSEQRVVLGALALAMAVGALASGFLIRRVGVVPLSLIGIVASAVGLVVTASCGPDTDRSLLLGGLAMFGLGFGLTVTPRSTAAVEALGRRAFGIASAGVTVARMVGMAIGLAVLTGFGTSRIEALSVVLDDAVARDAVLPVELRGRPLEDPQVFGSLESWAALQAASILGGIFLVAAVACVLGVVPTLWMRGSTGDGGRASITPDGAPGGPEDDGTRPAFTG